MNNHDLKIYEVLFPDLKNYSKQDLENLILELRNLDWSTISNHEIKECEYATYLLSKMI